MTINTPLLKRSKAESIKFAKDILGDRFDSIIGMTHTCYQGVRGGCGECAACLLRDKGFKEADMQDPIWVLRRGVTYD